MIDIFEEQWERKRQAHIAAAKLPIEEKIENLIKLQHIAYEIAKATGRPCKKPWDLTNKSN